MAYPLTQATFDELQALFMEDCPEFVSFEQPGARFFDLEIHYKQRLAAKFAEARPKIEALIHTGKGLEAAGLLQRAISGNIITMYAWRYMLGTTDAQATAVLAEVWKQGLTPAPDWGAVFKTCDAQGTKAAWDLMSQLLWALNPVRYFPIKIKTLRRLAMHCGTPLPTGRPSLSTFPPVLEFMNAFRDKLQPLNPRDMTDVQSWVWHVAKLLTGEVEDSEDDEERDEQPAGLTRLNEESASLPISANSRPRLWLIAPGQGARLWQDWRAKGEISIGWDMLDDLTEYETLEAISLALKLAWEEEIKSSLNAKPLWDFCREIKIGDFIIAKRGRTALLGYGVVLSEYRHETTRVEYRHVRSVQWKSVQEVDISSQGLLPMKTLTKIVPGGLTQRLLAQHYGVQLPGWPVLEPISPAIPTTQIQRYTLSDAMEGLFMAEDEVTRLIDTLRRKKNLILQGPPGVGKTFIARRLAYLAIQQKDPERVAMVQFHPSYAYEDFIQGLRPTKQGGFELREGIFLKFCRRAQVDPARDYVFIIDEINRGNLGKIFGELMLLIERDKRGSAHAIPLAAAEDEDDTFFVPENVHIIGLMNTADRSLALVDYALRRRFAFVTLRPGFDHPAFTERLKSLGAESSFALRIVQRLGALNEAISDDPHLGTDFVIGHSFFTPMTGCTPDDAWFADVVHHEVAPLLAEYWLDDLGQEKVKAHVAELLA